MRRTVLQCWFGLGFRGYSSPDIDGDIPTALRRFIILHQLILASYSQPEAAGFILRGIKGIFVAIGSVIAAVICAIVAAMKGRNPFGWGILGLFFSILTLIVVIVIPSKK
jgi:hypothetical protein